MSMVLVAVEREEVQMVIVVCGMDSAMDTTTTAAGARGGDVGGY